MFHEFIDDPAQIPFIDVDIGSNLLCSSRLSVTDLIQHASLREGHWRVEKVPVEQPDDIGVEAVEASDFVDQFLVHIFILAKILDFVKYYRKLKM